MTVLHLVGVALRLLAHKESVSSVTHAGIEGTINTATPEGVHFSSKYIKSAAHYVVNETFTTVIANFAEDLRQNNITIIRKYGQDAERDIEVALVSLSQLTNEIKSNEPFKPLVSNRSDVALWNSFLNEQTKKDGTAVKWYSGTFLHTQCYLYRRVKQIFELSKTLQNFDFCQKRKETSLIQSMGSCTLFANYLIDKLSESNLTSEELGKEAIRLIKLSMWSNRFDMSITLGLATSSKDNPMELIDRLEEFIMVDDTEAVLKKLIESKNINTSIDFVNDNAGYELFADLCLADFLLTSGFASTIHFHVKAFSWYVSDTTMEDIVQTVDILSEMGSHSASLPELSKRWKSYLDSGRWEIHTSDFWTLPHAYFVMPKIDPVLYRKLSQSSLLIFKGDLNYRKLMAGFHWPSTEGFTTALQGFQPTSLVSLRTIKSDVICGLQPGQVESVSATNFAWNVCGDYGLVQYSGN